MPLYDFKCDDCGTIAMDEFFHSFKDSSMKCPKCGSDMRKLISKPVPRCFPSDGVFLEHVSAEGKTFHSTSEMRKFERDNNMELGYLL